MMCKKKGVYLCFQRLFSSLSVSDSTQRRRLCDWSRLQPRFWLHCQSHMWREGGECKRGRHTQNAQLSPCHACTPTNIKSCFFLPFPHSCHDERSWRFLFFLLLLLYQLNNSSNCSPPFFNCGLLSLALAFLSHLPYLISPFSLCDVSSLHSFSPCLYFEEILVLLLNVSALYTSPLLPFLPFPLVRQIPHVKIGPEETPRLPYLRFASVTLYPSNEDLSLAIGAILRSFSYPSASLVCAKAECEYTLCFNSSAAHHVGLARPCLCLRGCECTPSCSCKLIHLLHVCVCKCLCGSFGTFTLLGRI